MAPTLEEFLKLSKTQKNNLTKPELLEILDSTPTNANGNAQLQTLIVSLTSLTEQIKALTQSFADHQETTRIQFNQFKEQLAKQDEIIAKQQIFLERQDSKERECNLVILGIPDDNESLDGAATDSEKLKKVWDAAGIQSEVKSWRQIGRYENSKKRPIIAVVNSREDRDSALDKGKSLKEHTQERYHRIYVKKDQHPSVRQEWKRLHTVFKTEKERPGNINCDIQFNFRERKIYKDNVVIDQWNIRNF